MTLLELPIFPYPPSINKKFISTRGKFVASPQVRQYKQTVINFMNADGTTEALKALLKEAEAIHLMVLLHRKNWITKAGKPSKTAGDIDAGIKVLQDAIFAAIKEDDSRVFSLTIKKSNQNLGFGFDFAPHVSVYVSPFLEWKDLDFFPFVF